LTILIIILSVLLLISGGILAIKLKVETDFENNVFNVKVFLLKFRIFENNKLKRGEEAKTSPSKKTKEFNAVDFILGNKEMLYEDLKDVLAFAKKKIHVYDFFVNLSFGVSDAADTGKLTGALWSFVGLVFPVLDSSLTFDIVPTVNITPVFNNPCFEFSYKGNYSLRVIHIIKLAIKILKKYKKYKGGVQNGSTSN